MTDDRKRVFATIVYPDSAPADWINILRDLHAPIFISPLHDRDLFSDHTPKKAHYHVMFILEGKMTQSQIKIIFDQIGGVGFEKILSTRSYARYLCHLDEDQELKPNQEFKPRYSIERLIQLGGASYMQYCDKSMIKYDAIAEMLEWIEANNVIKTREVINYARKYRKDWFGHLCDGGVYLLRDYFR